MAFLATGPESGRVGPPAAHDVSVVDRPPANLYLWGPDGHCPGLSIHRFEGGRQ
jgi:hypothetical protein